MTSSIFAKLALANLPTTFQSEGSKFAAFILFVICFYTVVSLSLLDPFELEPISDEGVYVTQAKALATTGEYKIISLPGDPYHTKYPVLYPWFLSLVWHISPSFPFNIPFFRGLSVFFGIGFLSLLALLLLRISREPLMPPGGGTTRDENRAILLLKREGECPRRGRDGIFQRDTRGRLTPAALIVRGFSEELFMPPSTAAARMKIPLRWMGVGVGFPEQDGPTPKAEAFSPPKRRCSRENKIFTLAIVTFCALHPAVIWTTTAVTSEAAYLFFSILALVVLVEWDRRQRSSLLVVLTAISLAFVFYVRIIGIALLAASLIHCASRKRWVDATLLLVITLTLIFPWLYWCHIHNESERFPEYVFNTSYLLDFKRLLETHGLGELLFKNAIYILVGIPKLLLYPFQTNLRLITSLTAWLGLPIVLLLGLGFVRSFRRRGMQIIHWYVLSYLFILFIWPYPAGERFLVPLLPFLCLFASIEIGRIFEQAKNGPIAKPGPWTDSWKSKTTLAPLIFMGLAFLCLVSHSVKFVMTRRNHLGTFQERNGDLIESFHWIQKETAPSDFLMSDLDPIYFLYTGRKTAKLSFDPRRQLTTPRFDEAPLRKHKIKYLVVGESDFGVFTPDVVQAMRMELHRVLEEKTGLLFERVFKSSRGRCEIYRIKDERQTSS